MLGAGGYLVSLLLDYGKSNAEYEAIEEAAVTESPEATEEGDTDDFEIDWDYLHALNPDIVAWVRFPVMDLSYPIVQGKDNSQYLHTTIEGTSAYAGAIFMDAVCNRDFSDDNTIIYGHNMRNLSMFGKLKLLYRDEATRKDNPYFWIYTEDARYTYSIFAIGNARIADKSFSFVSGSDAEKQAYLDFCMDASQFAYDIKATVNDSIVTLSTCTANSSDTYRFQVHGILTETKNLK